MASSPEAETEAGRSASLSSSAASVSPSAQSLPEPENLASVLQSLRINAVDKWGVLRRESEALVYLDASSLYRSSSHPNQHDALGGAEGAAPSERTAPASELRCTDSAFLYGLDQLYLCDACGRLLGPLQVLDAAAQAQATAAGVFLSWILSRDQAQVRRPQAHRRGVRTCAQVRDQVEAHICTGCLDVLPPVEAAASGSRCAKCFDCPRCFHTLSLGRKKAAPLQQQPFSENILSPPPAALLDDVQLFIAEAEAAEHLAARGEGGDDGAEESLMRKTQALAAADAAVEAMLKSQRQRPEEDAAAADAPGVDGVFVGGVPQRCDSLLSVRSLDELEEEGGEEDEELREEAASPRRRVESSGDFAYFYSCAHCHWSSETLGVSVRQPSRLLARACEEERLGLESEVFAQVSAVLQRNAFEKARVQDLQRRVKNKAVALFLASVSNAALAPLPPKGKNPRDSLAPKEALDDDACREPAREAEAAVCDAWKFGSGKLTFAPRRVALAALVQGLHLRGGEAAELRDSKSQKAHLGDDACDAQEELPLILQRTAAFSNPLFAAQLIVDRGSPDSPPPAVFPSFFSARRKSLPIEERPGIRHFLHNPASLASGACGCEYMTPQRKVLLPRRSKRCLFCEQLVVKAQVSASAAPLHRLNFAAALSVPWIETRPLAPLEEGECVTLFATLWNPLELPVAVALRAASPPPAAAEGSTSGLAEGETPSFPHGRLSAAGESTGGADFQSAEPPRRIGQGKGLPWDAVVEWRGCLETRLEAYSSLIEEVGPNGHPQSAVEIPPSSREAFFQTNSPQQAFGEVRAQWSNGALLELRVLVRPGSAGLPAFLPLRADLQLGGCEGEKIQVVYVAFLGFVGAGNESLTEGRTDTF